MANTGPMGSRIVNANLWADAAVKPMGISSPAAWDSSLIQISTPSIARATSTRASIKGLPPSLAIKKASCSDLPSIICTTFLRMRIRSSMDNQDLRLRNKSSEILR